MADPIGALSYAALKELETFVNSRYIMRLSDNNQPGWVCHMPQTGSKFVFIIQAYVSYSRQLIALGDHLMQTADHIVYVFDDWEPIKSDNWCHVRDIKSCVNRTITHSCCNAEWQDICDLRQQVDRYRNTCTQRSAPSPISDDPHIKFQSESGNVQVSLSESSDAESGALEPEDMFRYAHTLSRNARYVPCLQ